MLRAQDGVQALKSLLKRLAPQQRIRHAAPKDRKKMKGERSLEIEGETWGWKLGKNNVVIVRPSGRKEIVGVHHLFHVERHGLTDATVVSPGDIERYVRRHFLGTANHA